MSMHDVWRNLKSALAVALLAGPAVVAAGSVPAPARQPGPGLGVPAPPYIVAKWDATVFPDGRGLPPGSGTAAQGKAIYDDKCASCHGPEGRGETAEELVGRDTPLTDPDTAQTVGSFWPYATTLFDYTRRAMPMDRPGSLTADEVYAVLAYLLHLNGIIDASSEMDATTLPAVSMPNRAGFVPVDVGSPVLTKRPAPAND